MNLNQVGFFNSSDAAVSQFKKLSELADLAKAIGVEYSVSTESRKNVLSQKIFEHQRRYGKTVSKKTSELTVGDRVFIYSRLATVISVTDLGGAGKPPMPIRERDEIEQVAATGTAKELEETIARYKQIRANFDRACSYELKLKFTGKEPITVNFRSDVNFIVATDETRQVDSFDEISVGDKFWSVSYSAISTVLAVYQFDETRGAATLQVDFEDGVENLKSGHSLVPISVLHAPSQYQPYVNQEKYFYNNKKIDIKGYVFTVHSSYMEREAEIFRDGMQLSFSQKRNRETQEWEKVNYALATKGTEVTQDSLYVLGLVKSILDNPIQLFELE